jgi:hypothetical protein
MPYRHDVFLSYRRDSFCDDWFITRFIPVFKYKIRQAIAAETGRLPQSIFFDHTDVSAADWAFADQEGIEPGENWRAALEDAIRYSRCRKPQRSSRKPRQTCRSSATFRMQSRPSRRRSSG